LAPRILATTWIAVIVFQVKYGWDEPWLKKTAYVYVDRTGRGRIILGLSARPSRLHHHAQSPEEIEPKLREAVELYLSYYRDRGQSPPPARAKVGSLIAA